MVIQIDEFENKTAAERKVEIVERKGQGHPDYISDAIAEKFSNKLYKIYHEELNRPLHYNVDKLQTVGGKAITQPGGGRIKDPISVIFSGRAVNQANEKIFDIKEIAKRSAKEVLNNIRFLDPEKHVEYSVKTKEGSSILQGAVENPRCNDTSLGVAFWPLSDLEGMTLNLEKHMNSREFKKEFPFTGEDVKVMGVREGDKINLTIAVAFIDRLISSYEDYFRKKGELKLALKDYLKNQENIKVNLKLNTLDNKAKDQAYLTVTGTSLECGDDGAVGRGNRINGLITPCRPMSLEAVAGKNVVSHTGKLYNVLALEIAKQVYESGADFCSVKLLSRIGKPLNKPHLTSINHKGGITEERVREIYLRTMDRIPEIREKIVKGDLKLF